MTPQNTNTQARRHDRIPVRSSGIARPAQQQEEPQYLYVPAAKGVPFWVPEQDRNPGRAIAGPDGEVPRLFAPLKIREIELPNRIWVSPMCQYSAHEGFHTPWHTAHYGGILQRGVSIRSTCYFSHH